MRKDSWPRIWSVATLTPSRGTTAPVIEYIASILRTSAAASVYSVQRSKMSTDAPPTSPYSVSETETIASFLAMAVNSPLRPAASGAQMTYRGW